MPDPEVERCTHVTIAALDRATAAERDHVSGQIAILVARLDAMDRATEVLSATVNRVPTEVQREIGHLREIVDEHNAGIRRALGNTVDALRDHVTEQVAQIRAALAHAETLEVERIAAVRTEQGIVTANAVDAIGKAELANEKRFEEIAASRNTLIERERAVQESTMRQLAALMPREVAEAQITELRRQINEIAEKVSKLA